MYSFKIIFFVSFDYQSIPKKILLQHLKFKLYVKKSKSWKVIMTKNINFFQKCCFLMISYYVKNNIFNKVKTSK